jgi:hypothetical protein
LFLGDGGGLAGLPGTGLGAFSFGRLARPQELFLLGALGVEGEEAVDDGVLELLEGTLVCGGLGAVGRDRKILPVIGIEDSALSDGGPGRWFVGDPALR